MKKTLAAVAVLGAFAGSALAADVTLYGRIDTGLQFHDWENTFNHKTTDGTDWSMESGSLTASRVGIKGSEQISEGLTVGFTLEKGFKGDTGAAGDVNKAFDRESSIHVKTDFGTVYAGRFNSMFSDGGPTGFWAADYMALGTGNGVALGTGLMVGHSRADNRVAYVSPEFAGLKVYAEYAFGGNGDDENTSKNDRPAALGVNYNAGAFGAGLVVTYLNEKSWIGETDTTYEVVEGANGKYEVAVDTEGKPAHGEKQENEITVNFGTHYDFGVANVKLGAQYFKNADQSRIGAFGDIVDATDFTSDELEGYSVALGADFPMMGGTLTAGVGYMDGEDKTKNSKVEFKGYEAATYYQYPLSKRTKVYAGVGYSKVEAENGKADYESDAFKAMAGMAHYF